MSLTDAINACDLRELIRDTCGELSARSLGERGGTIRDPRPGYPDEHPSFSVFRARSGTWLFKRRGAGNHESPTRSATQGNAYDFLISLGYTPARASAALIARTGVRDQGRDGVNTRCARLPGDNARDVLRDARSAHGAILPARPSQLAQIWQRARALRGGHPAATELQRRGLWPPGDLMPLAIGEDLIFPVRGPTGRIFNVKRRHARGRRYSVMIPGLSTPAWCNPGYGKAPRVLLIEGELNAAAAWRVSLECGLDIDVQGLPGTDTWPHLSGLDREVWVLADADEGGRALRARMQDLAFACGATRVRQVAELPIGTDLCDLLGTLGVQAAHDALHARDRRAHPHYWPRELDALLRSARPGAPLFPPISEPDWPLRRP